jgi:hypothetical protein
MDNKLLGGTGGIEEAEEKQERVAEMNRQRAAIMYRYE